MPSVVKPFDFQISVWAENTLTTVDLRKRQKEKETRKNQNE